MKRYPHCSVSDPILLKNEIIASRFEKHTDFKIGEEKQKTVKTSKKRFVKDKKN